jgi:serine/threonine-protein kinase
MSQAQDDRPEGATTSGTGATDGATAAPSWEQPTLLKGPDPGATMEAGPRPDPPHAHPARPQGPDMAATIEVGTKASAGAAVEHGYRINPALQDTLGPEDLARGRPPVARYQIDSDFQETTLLGTTTGDSGESVPLGETMIADASGSQNSSPSGSSLLSGPPPASAVDWPDVAGYKILGELGRGGMGVVYKARQRGLNRTVALKMVLAGVHAGSQQLVRFQTEAESVARVQHPNIVQIHEVGEADGLPFLSLEFVDGAPLDKQMGGNPQDFRFAAKLIETLARAVYFAHQQGIIHRDLKPANILMTADGVPKITDFGLAKRMEEIDSSQTRSGTIMGTPSYMAPEQARGDILAIGYHADQYSLGAMLYEMLTGRPPFVGATAMETVMKVTRDEPTPPSQLRPDLPRDLETICLKALQKDVHKRYPNAFEMAADLGRFLAGEPILARPVGPAERLWRWCKRNPKVAALTLSTFGLLVAGLAISAGAAIVIASERNLKERERIAAVEARKVADEQRDIADEQRDIADTERKAADEQLVLAIDTIKTLIHEVQNKLENVPKSQELKKDLLKTAVVGLNQVGQRARGTSSMEVAYSLAAANMRLSQVFKLLGLTDEAFQHLLACHEINLKQLEAHPESDRARKNLAASYTVLGEMSLEVKREVAASLENYEKALKLREGLFYHPVNLVEAKPKEIEQGLGETYTRVGVTLLRMGDPARARDQFLKALELREELAQAYPDEMDLQQDLARTYHAVGEMSNRLDDLTTGRRYYDLCLVLREQLAQAHPEDLRLKAELQRWCLTLGDLALRADDASGAKQAFERSLMLAREMFGLDEKNVDYQRSLAAALYQVATAEGLLGEREATDRHFRECLAIREARYKAQPGNSRAKMDLIGVLAHCGDDSRAAELAEELLKEQPKDVEVAIAVACSYATSSSLADDAEKKRRDIEHAFEALGRAVDLGFRDAAILRYDPDLGPIREGPAWRDLMDRIKAKASPPATPAKG